MQERQTLLQGAFSGTVHEKTTQLPTLPLQTPNPPHVSEPRRPVSKFKSQAASINAGPTVAPVQASKTMPDETNTKPVSRFKAQRLNKDKT